MFHIVIEHPPEEARSRPRDDANPHFTRPVSGADWSHFRTGPPCSGGRPCVCAVALRTSRPKAKNAPESVKKWVAFGASVRAAQFLVLGAKARALTNGRYHVSFDDIKSMAHPVMRHRVLINFRAESEGVTTDQIIDELLERVPVPVSGM
jgi:hypothetical protein